MAWEMKVWGGGILLKMVREFPPPPMKHNLCPQPPSPLIMTVGGLDLM